MNKLHTRLLIAFALFGITPYLLTMLYFSYWEKEKRVHAIEQRYASQAKHAKTIIENELLSLQEDVEFLAKLEVMDELISQDVDFQISRLLDQKSIRANKHYLKLYAINTNGEVIASSENAKLLQHYTLSVEQLKKHKRIIQNGTLYMVQNVYASFDNLHLGYLIAEFPISSLNNFLPNNQTTIFHIVDIKSYKPETQEQTISGSLHFSKILDGYAIIYSVPKDKVLQSLDNFLQSLLYATLLGIVVILVLGRLITNAITQPIYTLKKTVRKIISTKDFHLQVQPLKIEEFDDLRTDFNELFNTAQSLLDELEEQNKQRLQKFIGLIKTFNNIIASKNQQNSTSLALDAIVQQLNYPIMLLPKKPLEDDQFAISYYDYTKERLIDYGYLSINAPKPLTQDEVLFVKSVLAMLSNHLERLTLQEKIIAASQAKSDFISGMSHELRTPLNAIIGYAQFLIAYEDLNDDQLDSVSKIEKSAYHLTQLINDILDIAKIEAGKIETHPKEFLLCEALQECVEIVSSLAQEKSLALQLSCNSFEDLTITNDSKILKQIVLNLLSNSIKFTHRGYVALRVSKQENTIVVEVQDSGMGIAKKDLESVFDSFTQLKNAQFSSTKGSGLGLALCKKLATAIGATLTLQSKGLGKGTTAVLTINLSHYTQSPSQ